MKPRRMVVKQQAKSLDKLEEEAGFLRLIGGTGSSHVVRLFRGVFRDRGQGTVAGFDEMGISVGRMYLEYCEGGDFGGFVMGMYRYVAMSFCDHKSAHDSRCEKGANGRQKVFGAESHARETHLVSHSRNLACSQVDGEIDTEANRAMLGKSSNVSPSA